MVYRPIACDAEEPGVEAPRWIEAARRAPRLKKDVLQHVLRIGRSDEAAQIVEDGSTMLGVRLVYCRIIARGKAVCEVGGGHGLMGAASARPAPTMDLVDTAVAAGQFTTLAKAVAAAGLVDTLKTGGPYTVLAPTDAAFAKVPADTLNALLADKAALTKVLTYHVLQGAVPASTVVTLTSATPLKGEPIAINVNSSGVFLNGTTKVIQTDIKASNGVIHVIDSVLLPPSMANAAMPAARQRAAEPRPRSTARA